MPNAINKLSTKLAAKIAERVADINVKELIEKTNRAKASGEDTGTFRIIITDESTDRHGEVILQDGLDITNYMKNPVVLFGHDYWSLPIGVTERIIREVINGVRVTIAEGHFASADANPEAQKIRRLYDEKILTTASVGIIAHETQGNVITKSELLEWSFVPVPANPNALSVAKEIGLGSELIAKIFGDTKTKDTENADPEARDEGQGPEEPGETQETAKEGGEAIETTETTSEAQNEPQNGKQGQNEGTEKAAERQKVSTEQIGAIMNKLQNAILNATTQATRDLVSLASVEEGKGAPKSTDQDMNTTTPAKADEEPSKEGGNPGTSPNGEGTGNSAQGSAEELADAARRAAKAQQVLKLIATATGEVLAELNRAKITR
jgi:hypothetical protein